MPLRLRSQFEALANAFAASVLLAVRAAPLEELGTQGELQRPVAPRRRRKHARSTPLKDALVAIKAQRVAEAEVAYRVAVAAAHATKAGGVDACARALGLTRQTLSPYALVASQWPARELKRLLAERRNVHGDPISISHLVELAKLAPAQRERWLERTFSQGLTVRELRAELLKSRMRPRRRK